MIMTPSEKKLKLDFRPEVSPEKYVTFSVETT